ncbi:MAG: conjugal transfer protein TraG N-terminal domain-containing protein [Gammaproteobacteria bacterium]
MSLEFSVVTYGNGSILREVFNAIAAAMNASTSYGKLIHLAVGLAGAWAMLAFIHRRSLVELVRWFALYYLAFYVIFLPKATVNIIDRVAQGRVYTVDHVPLGLAVLASYTSVIGDGLTQLVEENFSLPDDLRYSQSGMVFASSIVTAASTFQITDPVFENNLQDFINQCVFYDLLLNKYSAQDLLSTPNIWQFVAENASPARAFMYGQTVVTCKNGVSLLERDWQTAIDQAATQYGARLFPGNTEAKTQLLKYLPLSYNFLTNISEDASGLIQQNMMANAVQNGLLGWSARTNAPAALSSYAFNKSQQQNRISNRTMGDLAAYWLPLLKNVFEGILYGAFIFVFLLLGFPFGLRVLQQYAYSLLWLQLWAPLYAIINLYASFYAQSHSLGAINSSQGTVLSLATQAGLAQVNADMTGLAGYLSLSVPLIATGIVKGMSSIFSHVAQYVGGSLQSSAVSAGGEVAGGNLSLGNTHFNTHQANNTAANHFDTNARTSTGMMTSQMPGGSLLSFTASGSEVMNNQPAISSLGTSINLASAIRTTAMQQADVAYSEALSHQQSYSESISQAKRQVLELSQQQGLSQSIGESIVVSDSKSQMTALSEVAQNSIRDNQYGSTTHFKGTHEQATIGAQAGVGGGIGISSLKASMGASGNISKTWNAGDNQQTGITHSTDISHNQSESHSVDEVLRGVKEGSYRATTEQGQRMLDSISNSLDHAQQEQELASQQFQKAVSYREVATKAEENSVSINSNATQEFMEQLRHDKGAKQIEQLMVERPEEA